MGLRLENPHGLDGLGHLLFEGRHLLLIHGLELTRDAQVLLQFGERVSPNDRAGDGLGPDISNSGQSGPTMDWSVGFRSRAPDVYYQECSEEAMARLLQPPNHGAYSR